jgi:hypothetical protein
VRCRLRRRSRTLRCAHDRAHQRLRHPPSAGFTRP